eukprot:5059130-Pyramimonas_sp.AAC.1
MFGVGWVRVCGRPSPRMLARAAADQFGATDAASAALTGGYFPTAASVRISDLGGRGIMAMQQ